MTQSVKDTSIPNFNEKITIPIYKRETEDVPLLVVQDVDPDEEEILSRIEINFSKIAYSEEIETINEKWYSFIEDNNKEIKIKLTFTSAKHQGAKEVPKSVEETKEKPQSREAPSEKPFEPPKFIQFKFDDQSLPDPKDTGKFRDEFPSEPSEKAISEYEPGPEDPPKLEQFNINDATVDVSQGSGNFEEME